MEIVSETTTEEVMDTISRMEGMTVTGFSDNRMELTIE